MPKGVHPGPCPRCGARNRGAGVPDHWEKCGRFVSQDRADPISAQPRVGRDTADELREEIARALVAPMPDWRGGPDGDYWLMRADAVLALPSVRRLLDAEVAVLDLAATIREQAAKLRAVETLAEAWRRTGNGPQTILADRLCAVLGAAPTEAGA